MTPQEQRLKARLEDIGIQFTITYHPLPEYEVRYSSIRVSSPSADQALLLFISELIKLVPQEDKS